MTVVAIDRLVHRAAIFELHVESYRRRTAIDRHASGSAQRLPRSRPPTTPLQFFLPVGQLPATLPSSPGLPILPSRAYPSNEPIPWRFADCASCFRRIGRTSP